MIATVVALLGGLAAAKHLPGQITIPLGFGLFFAPGYLWSEAILTHRLPGFERAMTSAGMALIFPILGGFLFYGLHIPLKEPAWVGLLVVLTLLGVVAVAIQRLREEPEDPREQQQRRNQPPPQRSQSLALHAGIYGLAGLIAIGAIGYSVKSAEAQKFTPYTALSMTQVINDTAAQDTARLSNDLKAQDQVAQAFNNAQPKATQAHLRVTNYEGIPEQYQLKLYVKGKVKTTWNITLNSGQSWQQTVAWSVNYSIAAKLFLLPNVTKAYRSVNNGI